MLFSLLNYPVKHARRPKSLLIPFFFLILPIQILAEENLKIGLLIPMTGENENLGYENSSRIPTTMSATNDVVINVEGSAQQGGKCKI